LGPDNKKVIGNLGPGSFIGDLATLSGAKRNISVVAKTFVLIKEISIEELEKILATYPEVHSEMK
jgi:CRP-like cAMP-binding protein